MAIPIIGDLIEQAGKIIGKAVIDKDKQAEIQLELVKLGDQAQARLDNLTAQQIEINKIEAASGSLFVAGWRPFIGWVGGCGLAAQSIVIPLIAQATGRNYELNTELLIFTMSSILGIGGMRTWEKFKGVSTNDFRDTPNAPIVQKVQQTTTVVETQKAPEPEAPKPKKKFKIF